MPTKTKPKKKTSNVRVPKFPPKGAAPAPEATTAPQEPATSPIDADPQDNALQLVLKTQVTLDDTSLKLLDNTTFEQWQEVYAFAEKLNERGKWWLGDIIRFAEGKFPDRYTQAVEITALSYSRLTTIVSVCGRIDPARRRKEAKFSFHELIAYLPYQTGDHLLDRAIKEKWTHEQLADAVARSKGEPTKAERKAEKERQKGVKVLPNSANGAPPTLDGHLTLELQQAEKPLIWNGRPLTVAISPEGQRLILEGPEILTSEEADRAAHHHKHAHGPALAAWLEEHNFIKGGDEKCATSDASAEKGQTETTIAPSTEMSPATSNGAAPNATEPAPTPDLAALDAVVEANLRGQTPAPAAPPASPEPNKPLGQADDYDRAIHTNPDARAWAAFFMKTKAGAPTIADDEECMMGWFANAMMAMHDHMEGKRQREEAAKTPLQRAEEAILRFNEASKDVDWTEVGKNALRRAKWLGTDKSPGLLNRADECIDLIQSNPPAQRK